jgi:sugar phosphate isomerase/epimerase
MRLGGHIVDEFEGPDGWVKAAKAAGYRAVVCPLSPDADDDTVREYEQVAADADLMIAEVGAWSNPLSANDDERTAALANCKARLHLADRIGSRCCVNIAGSRGEKWAGPHPLDMTEETFDMIVETVREIIDDVGPSRSYYTLETMPWMYPDSADCYVRLIKAIARGRFAVHLDVVNLISSPQRYFANDRLIRDCFEKLGGYVRSCHAKDIVLQEPLTVHLDEVRPGLGMFDYKVFLTELAKLEDDIPVMMEHLQTAEDYRLAGEYIRGVADELGIEL